MIDNLQPVSFSDIAGWQNDNHHVAFQAFLQTAKFHLENRPYRQKVLPTNPVRFHDICLAARRLSDTSIVTDLQARAFFQKHFTPFQINETGFVTGYYEPEIDVRFEKDQKYKYPFYRRPDDLVDIGDPDNPPDGVKTGYAFAKKTKDGFIPYPARQQIDQGYLNDRDLEIAYAHSKADVYFTHIQGSARLNGANGVTKRIAYAAKSGHPYTSIGKILIKRGAVAQENMSMDAIRKWMDDNPTLVDKLLWCNQSYIFFEEPSEHDPFMGPIGAAKIQLSNRRSLAVDKSIYQFGLPIFITVEDAGISLPEKHFKQLMIAQDTGSAILGPARGDIFIGSGLKAGQLAGNIAHQAIFYVLLPKDEI